jgi:putative salt-induced outer membrane protein YdiY
VSLAGRLEEIELAELLHFLGLNNRTGNTSQTEANASASLTRRTPRDRVNLELLGNFTETDGTTTADSQRASAGWNHFVSDRFYLTPGYAEFYRDPFQNILARWTAGFGVGYQIIDTKKVEWNTSVGLAYQRTNFEEVPEGEPSTAETPALVLGTRYDNELAKWVDYFFSYRAYVVNEESGTYTHNLQTGLEFEIVKDFEFDVSVVWDRIEDPQPGADGTIPLQDDFRTIFALGYKF